VKLLARFSVSPTSKVVRFALPDPTKSLGLSTCACILSGAKIGDDESLTVRPYTPISTNAQIGSFDLLIKYYETGKMSRYLTTGIEIGEEVAFKHIPFNVKIQAPFKASNIGILAGGTGISPMIQALHAILGGDENIKVSLLYGSLNSKDILGQEMLEKWADKYKNFTLTHVLSKEPQDSLYKGERGFIGKDLIGKHFAKPSLGDDVMIFVCGPPPMYKAMCGARDDPELTGILADMGYTKEQVYKF